MSIELDDTQAIDRAKLEQDRERASRLPHGGWVARAVVAAVLLGAVITLIAVVPDLDASRIGYAFIFAIVGISMNVLLGYGGQISLGHHAFYGIGAFTAGFVVTNLQLDFLVSIPAAALSGAVAAAVLGAAALRIGGLLLALVTLTYGAVAESTIFLFRPFTGGGSGLPAPKPQWASTDTVYAYVCLAILLLVLYVDWRFVRSKAGRAVQAVRDSERVAASMGINVMKYKLLAFVLSGALAGLAGGLFAHSAGNVVASLFTFLLALEFVLMTVVGGLRSRAGVVVGSMFFALLDRYFRQVYEFFIGNPDAGESGVMESVPGLRAVAEWMQKAIAEPSLLVATVGAGLLILTLIGFPGGIGQQLRPITNWFSGGKFDLSLIHTHGTASAGGEDVRP